MEPLILSTKYDLAFRFRSLVEQQKDCNVIKVIELISGKVIQYWIDCPKEKENEITDMAFMTWIKNPVFQRYYHNTPEFTQISDEYILSRNDPTKEEPLTGASPHDDAQQTDFINP